MYQVEITPSAEGDIEAICDYISQDSPENAAAFIAALEQQIETLAHLPERCPLIPENEILGTSCRQLLHGNYRTIFRVAAKTVIILRVIHGARLLDDSLM